jgi:hypothetical protein
MRTFVDETEFVVVNCGKEDCYMDFAMPERFYRETKRTGITWYCPRGHSRVWKGPTVEQELKAAKAQTIHLEDQLSAAIRDAETTRQELLRDRQRFANGVCPCCQRSFQNVRRHVRTVHPELVDELASAMARPMYACSCGDRFETFRGLRTHQGHLRRDGWDRPNQAAWRAHLTRVGESA